MLGGIKVRVILRQTMVVIKIFAFDFLNSSTISEAEFYYQHAKDRKSKQKHGKQESRKCMRFVWKPRGRKKSQSSILDRLIKCRNNLRLSPIARAAGQTSLLLHLKTRSLAQTPLNSLGTLEPYLLLYKNRSVVAANGVVCV